MANIQTKKAALFILHLKERRNLSQVAVDDVLKEVNGLFSHVIGRITTEGSVIMFSCEFGFRPQDILSSVCGSNGQRQPDPGLHDCTG